MSLFLAGLLHALLIAVGAVATSAPSGATVERVAYDGGHLVTDGRYFEGTVTLRFVRDGHVLHRWCSSGAPLRSAGRVAWVTLTCPESGDITGTVLHRARADGSCRVDQRLERRPDTSGSVSLLRFRGEDLVYRSIDGARWRTDLAHPPHRIRRH